MRIVFCGTPSSAVPSLDRLAERAPSWKIEAVLSQPDRPAGRGRRAQASPVKERALELGLPVHTPEKLKECRQLLEEMRPDVVAVVAYGHIFRRWLLELPEFGCVNVHFSILPRHRGVAPVQWAILEGDRETGVTTMQMDRGVDTGAVFLERRLPIGSEDTAGRLTESLAELGGELLAETLEGIFAGELEAVPQEEEGATYARRLERADGRIDWTRTAAEIERQVRGLSPWPGTFTSFRGKNLKIHRVRLREGTLRSGEVELVEGVPCVGTARGLLELIEVQAEGKARTEGEAWVRGARPTPQDVLGVD